MTSAKRREAAPLPQAEPPRAAAALEQVRHNFDALFADTSLRLEKSVTRIVMWGAAFISLLAVLGLAMDSSMPDPSRSWPWRTSPGTSAFTSC